ncbi:MAG: pyridoxine 5'-phosphate synthase [Bdellovibrionota bacterium]
MLPRLGVNIDHIATLRQLRGTPFPDLSLAAQLCELAGAKQITVHLREDRRHIQDEDVKKLRGVLRVPLNLEMAATPAMTKFAIRSRPDWVCLVPEKREELTTEGGLNIKKSALRIGETLRALKKAEIKVSIFIEPSLEAVRLSSKLAADAVEIHTGRYCIAAQGGFGKRSKSIEQLELKKIRDALLLAEKLKLGRHAGHGFDFENVRAAAELLSGEKTALIEEYNIGHSIICRAAIVGLERAVREMNSAIVAP